MNNQKASITTKDLGTINELLNLEALAYSKTKLYAQYMQDTEANAIFSEMSTNHKKSFDAINQYLQGQS
ncbi:hypothetical protein LJC20_00270 [Eubacteriales bacterium OttesenSCG-928-M02]|nr:hypothetical protein [Eubacteriales bacterium OttesenSCG-928-M02]